MRKGNAPTDRSKSVKQNPKGAKVSINDPLTGNTRVAGPEAQRRTTRLNYSPHSEQQNKANRSSKGTAAPSVEGKGTRVTQLPAGDAPRRAIKGNTER